MTRSGWFLAALGVVNAMGNPATAADTRTRPSTATPSAASRRASEYFTRTSRQPAPEFDEESQEEPIETEKPLAPKSGSTRTAGSTASKSGFDARLRPKSPATPAAREVVDDEVPFGEEPAERPVDAALQKLRQKKVTGARTVSGESENGVPARTPSGAPLHRDPSPEEELSSVVHAGKTRGEEESWYDNKPGRARTVSAIKDGTTVEKYLEEEDKPSKPGTKATADSKSSKSTATEKRVADKAPARANVTISSSVPRPGARVTQPVTAEDDNPSTTSPAVMDEENSPRLTVRWVKRSDINVGQPCECDLVVKNHGTQPANEVTVEAHFPKSVRLTNSEPAPAEVTEHLTWNFPLLKGGEEKSIHIGMIPSIKGELATTARVRFSGVASSVFQVEEPMLAVQVKGPKEVLVGDPASHIIVVSNPGTGVANSVTVEAIIPKGLEHPRGERLSMEVGSLGPGESRTVRLALSAIQGGQHQIQVVAKADSDLVQNAVADVVVVAPSIKLNLDGPGMRYIGRNASYVLSAINDGAAPSNNVRVMHKVPEGFKFVKADKGGKFDESTQLVSWFVGRLEPGQQSQVKLELAPTKLGTFKHQAGVVSEQGAKSQAECETVVDGTAALQVEVVEQADPVEVGAETVYEIRLKNAGSKAAQNVGISCEMAAAVQLVTAKGPTEHLTENGLVVFKSLPSIAAGKTVTYQVHVKGTQEGSHRFRVRLASDSITEPLISEELTKFYGE
jgi:uncharacterized repeat protein (TIGR01451 family)